MSAHTETEHNPFDEPFAPGLMTARPDDQGEQPRRRTEPTVVLTTVSSDSHTWNLVYLELLLREWGLTVINLGAAAPDELIERTIEEHQPDGVIVSTVNGHGHLDGERLIRRLRKTAAGRRLPIIIGGKLDTEGGGDATAQRLIRAGYTAVAQDSIQPLRRLVSGIRRSRAIETAAGSMTTAVRPAPGTPQVPA
jgi:methylaspartate mutase sigma subunit